MKAAVSELVCDVKCGYNAIFIPRKNSPYIYADIKKSFAYLLKKADLLQ